MSKSREIPGAPPPNPMERADSLAALNYLRVGGNYFIHPPPRKKFEIWGGQLTMQPDFHGKLWKGQTPERFYKDCSRYVLDNQDSIREEVEMFRHHQLLEQAEANNNEERLQELQQLPQELNVLEPPLALWEEVSVGRHIAPESNPWTLTEFEGYILWLHKAMLGRYAVELSKQPAS